ncbi:MAG: hypothetical protein K8F91_12655, partial [Candidatus Obscuribacterales bacterium]|nr:hypothetical protein [Candidatus Obscuribacterales bacterium]
FRQCGSNNNVSRRHASNFVCSSSRFAKCGMRWDKPGDYSFATFTSMRITIYTDDLTKTT